MLGDQLATAGLKRVADVRRPNGEPLRCSEVTGFRKSSLKFIAILPGPDCADAGEVTLNLDAPRHVYNLRAHRALGRVARVRGTLVAGEPLLYAILPAPIGRLTIEPVAPSAPPLQAKAGETVKFTVRRAAQGGGEIPVSAAHLEVQSPKGKVVDYYGGNLLLTSGAAEFAVPLALDDTPGVWRVTAREPFAHQTASATFELTP